MKKAEAFVVIDERLRLILFGLQCRLRGGTKWALSLKS